MSIRNKAMLWFSKIFPDIDEPVKTSKCYIATESWTKSTVWWFEFSEEVLLSNVNGFTNLLCEISSDKTDFYFLRIPNKFLNENKTGLYTRNKKDKLVYSIYLSALPSDIFIEQRGDGKIDFSSFLINNQ